MNEYTEPSRITQRATSRGSKMSSKNEGLYQTPPQDVPMPTAPSQATSKAVSQFLNKLNQQACVRSNRSRARLIFALDATASRQSTWDLATHLQIDMFKVASNTESLDLQICYYQGLDTFICSPWSQCGDTLLPFMEGVQCLGGLTQIERVLSYALRETQHHPLHALVFVGDAVEEPVDLLAHLAGQLGLLNTPIFLFQEGQDEAARTTFIELAKLSKGAYHPFKKGSTDELRDLLMAVAAYATGGLRALALQAETLGGPSLALLRQLEPHP